MIYQFGSTVILNRSKNASSMPKQSVEKRNQQKRHVARVESAPTYDIYRILCLGVL